MKPELETFDSLLPQAGADSLRLGDHACMCYGSDRQFYDAVSEFVSVGLTRNERIFVYTDAIPVTAMREALYLRGVPVHERADTGTLRFEHSTGSYLRNGHFDVDATIDGWFQLIERAVADGFDGIRVVGDMGWAARDVSGSNQLFEYEGAIQREVYSSGRVVGICGYDIRSFHSSAVRMARELHSPHVLS